MKRFILAISVIMLLVVIGGTVMVLSKKQKSETRPEITEDLVLARKGYEDEKYSEFFSQSYNNKTYILIMNNALSQIIALKYEFPKFFEGLRAEPDNFEGASISLALENWEDKTVKSVSFNHYKGLYPVLGITFSEFKRMEIPEGKTPLPREELIKMNDITSEGLIGKMLVTLHLYEENEELKSRIIEILKQNGFVEDISVVG